jgi:uncharacterized protein YjdB
MSADPNPVLDVRDEIEETLCFANVIPETVKAGDKLNLEVVQSGATVSYKSALYDKTNKAWGASTAMTAGTSGEFTAPTTAGLYAITASASGYASWTTTVYVEAAS